MENIKIELIKVFGPSVLKATIPEKIVNELNSYVDKLISDEKKSKEQDMGHELVGDVTQELEIEHNVMQEIGWGKFLADCTSKWIEIETKKKITKFNILSSWVVRQFENEFNPTHWHGGHISGAGFLKVPKNMGKINQDKTQTKYKGGNLQFTHGARMFLSQSTMTVVPKVGDFYFFPNYLMHLVYPFRDTKEERRSISFNAKIDEEIFDVYGKKK